MNILIFEYITGGGFVDEPLPSSLVSEGELMLNAIANDFAELKDVDVSVLRDYRLPKTPYVKNTCVVNIENGYEQAIDAMAAHVDVLLIIAPESGNILVNLCEKYSNREFILLNCSVDSVELASDKLNTFTHFQAHNIAQIPTYSMSNLHLMVTDKIVIKSKDGVGCENLHVFESLEEANQFINQVDVENYIAQPYMQGQSASLSLLCWDGECLVLSANIQEIREVGGSLELKQCVVNHLDRNRFIEFSTILVKTMPGLKGYIGVDVLITDNEVLLVEVNPRLTTSYVGLKSALGINPAELILSTFKDQKVPAFLATQNTSVVIEIGAECAA